VRRFLNEPLQYLASHPVSPVRPDYRDAANLTERIEPPRANCVTVPSPRKRMNADGVRGIPFFMLRDAVFLNEYQAPDTHQMIPVTLPGGGFDRISAQVDHLKSRFSALENGRAGRRPR
jgi:hypothetical protein